MLETLDLEQVSAEVLREIDDAKRPVLVFGFGVKLAGAVSEARDFAQRLGIPICPTWGAIDAFHGCRSQHFDRDILVGAFGTHGVRAANFAIQNADYILCVGSRLDTKATGSPAASFATKAKLVMVDIDSSELDKMSKIGRPLYRSIRADARQFLMMLDRWSSSMESHDMNNSTFKSYDRVSWIDRILMWKDCYPVILPEYREETLNPYAIVEKLGEYIKPDDVIVSDTGCVLGWMMQAYKFKGERFVHAFNNTPMGYGLPALVGAAFATGKRCVLVTGDGGLSVNITELATIARHKLNVTIILFNNEGHAMCRQTQRQWLGGEYPSTSFEGGLATPDFQDVARSYGLLSYGPNSISAYGLDDTLGKVFRAHGGFLEIPIHPDHGLAPQAKFGHKLEDQEPLLSREELEGIMA